MDAKFQKEQNGTLFVWVGALEGGLGGGWSLRVVHPRYSKNKNKTPSCHLRSLFFPTLLGSQPFTVPPPVQPVVEAMCFLCFRQGRCRTAPNKDCKPW